MGLTFHFSRALAVSCLRYEYQHQPSVAKYFFINKNQINPVFMITKSLLMIIIKCPCLTQLIGSNFALNFDVSLFSTLENVEIIGELSFLFPEAPIVNVSYS